MEKLIVNLHKLRDALVASKNPSSEYISLLIEKICEPGLSEEATNDLLQQIKSGSKIVDFANFNRKQELIWMEIWNNATDILRNKNFL